ncbi:helix-turn-helix domain-containing protein [Halorubrum ezzemoulense]|uniref:winged helix-turn-helix domain-containing protein n=1 Tax=Halorubrum ezzemoulense TaxID=337243 RepID=UPI00232C6C91|nr:helix-turn-helix domain-containing protein [Halorubrum ezzemoulense]MDB2253088.1 helix-turn-helix domain-containing protein [Halorubrum ezzemoulense]
MQIPSQAELERFFGEDQAEEVQFLETVATWPSLRILEYLYANEPVTTGDLARGINMDMRDVKDRLEALEKQGVVSNHNGDWNTRSDGIQMTVQRGENHLEISHSIGASSESTDESTMKIVSRLSRLLNPFR